MEKYLTLKGEVYLGSGYLEDLVYCGCLQDRKRMIEGHEWRKVLSSQKPGTRKKGKEPGLRMYLAVSHADDSPTTRPYSLIGEYNDKLILT